MCSDHFRPVGIYKKIPSPLVWYRPLASIEDHSLNLVLSELNKELPRCIIPARLRCLPRFRLPVTWRIRTFR